MSRIRFVLGAAVLIALVLGVSLLFQRRPAAGEAVAFVSSSQCQACHAGVYAEWSSVVTIQSTTTPGHGSGSTQQGAAA